MMQILSAADTDVGHMREKNEDAYECSDELGVYLVSDGMGGAAAGEVASHTAASMIRQYIEENRNEQTSADDLARLVETATREANHRVYQAAMENPEYRGMGATVSGVMVREEAAQAFHVGDSRIYRLRDGSLEQLSEDHSWVQEQVRAGRLTPDEAKTHYLRNLITRVVGTEPEVEVDTFPVELRGGDILLLCSDGLNGMIEDEEIARILVDYQDDLNQTAAELINTANVAGGMDNITVVLVGVYE